MSRRARAHSPRPAGSASHTLTEPRTSSFCVTHLQQKKSAHCHRGRGGSAGGPNCKHLELESRVEAGGSGAGLAAALRRRDVCLARSHGCHGNPPLAGWTAGSGSQSDANCLLKLVLSPATLSRTQFLLFSAWQCSPLSLPAFPYLACLRDATPNPGPVPSSSRNPCENPQLHKNQDKWRIQKGVAHTQRKINGG